VLRDVSFRRIAAFLTTGAVATTISYVIFILLEPLVGWLPAAGAAWGPSVIIAFLMNRRLTFGIKGRARIERQFGLHLAGALSQLALSLAGYFLLIDVLRLSLTPAFFINLVFTTAFSYAFMSIFTFARRAQPAG
jgi:putative flippase GtrA